MLQTDLPNDAKEKNKSKHLRAPDELFRQKYVNDNAFTLLKNEKTQPKLTLPRRHEENLNLLENS